MRKPLADWNPRDIDVTTPSTARMYDYFLGGKDHFAVDREAGEKALAVFPDGRALVRANRGFLVEAVRRCAAAGIDQFLDLGTGIPTSPNVHEVARETRPAARVVYVDHDPIVTAHNRALRDVDANIGIVEADIRQPEAILTHPETRELIDFDRPVAVLAVAILHFVADEEDPAGIVAAFRDAMVPGSRFVLSVASVEGLTDAEVTHGREAWSTATSPMSPHSREQINEWLSGFSYEVAPVGQWCDAPATRVTFLAAIGEKVA